MKPSVWDTRKCHVGEGPVATGGDRNKIYWVDILNNRILSKDLLSGEAGQIGTTENVSFVLPRSNGGLIVGTANGPYAIDASGAIETLPTRADADGSPDPVPMRWNDAKVGPTGEIWITTSSNGIETDRIGLHRLSADGSKMERILSGMQLTNGLDWSPDTKTFYLIETGALKLHAFDYHNGHISNQRTVIEFDPRFKEYPDGMTVDAEGCLWIAFWNGSCIRRYSPELELIQTIKFPVRFVSSCTFAGTDLSTLVVTTATGDNGWHDEHELAGMTFTLATDVKGKASYDSDS